MTGSSQNALVIAEAGVNHDGSRAVAIELVDAAAEAGADFVKYQTFRAGKLATRGVARAGYQQASTQSTDSQLSMLEALELSYEDFRAIADACRARGIGFLSTPFDEESADFLVRDLNQPIIKIGSGDLTNAPLLLCIARFGRPVILSTGMGTLGDIEAALSVLAYGYLRPQREPTGQYDFAEAFLASEGQSILARNVTLLQCTTAYPAPPESANLRAMDTLHRAFGVPVGFSDHTKGLHIPVAAVALGARVVEKHLTLSRERPGPDHHASLEPQEFAAMVTAIRETEAALGSGLKIPGAAELANREAARRRLVAARPIAAGATLTMDDLAVKRAERGLSPFQAWSLIGRPAARDYASDDPIEQ